MIAALWGRLWGYVTAAAAGAALLAGLYLKARADGRAAAERDKAAREAAAIKAKKESDDAVERMPGADLDRELDRWVRDKR